MVAITYFFFFFNLHETYVAAPCLAQVVIIITPTLYLFT